MSLDQSAPAVECQAVLRTLGRAGDRREQECPLRLEVIRGPSDLADIERGEAEVVGGASAEFLVSN